MASLIREEDEERLTLSRVSNRPSKFMVVLTFFSGISGFLVGYDTGMISGAMVLLKENCSLNYAWQTALISGTIAAAGIFALVAGILNERFGRKPVIICASFVFSLGSLLAATSNTKTVLLAGRIVVGIGIGLTSMTCPVYIAEMSTNNFRGRLVTSSMILVAAGQLTASFIDGAFSGKLENGWRFMLGFGAIPSLVQFIGFIFMPESPQWLIAHDRHEAGKCALRKVRGEGLDLDEEFNLMKITIEEKHRNATGTKSVVKELISQPALRRAFIVGCGLHMFQQFIGINTILYYNASIIQMAGFQEKSTILWLACALSAIYFAWSFIGVCLVEKIGRRPLTLMSLLGVFISLIIIAAGFQVDSVRSPLITFEEELPAGIVDSCQSHTTCELCTRDVTCGFCFASDESNRISKGSCSSAAFTSDYTHSSRGRCSNATVATENGIYWAYDACPTNYPWLPIIGLAVYLSFFAIGLGPMPWTINSEIYPFWARNSGIATATSVNWFCCFLMSIVFLPFVSGITKYGVFWLFSGITVAAALFVYFVVPETKGRKLDEVEGLFATSWTYSENTLLPVEKPVQYVHIRGLNRDGRGKSMDESDSD